MKKMLRQHIYLPYEERERVKSLIDGDLSPYYRHSVLSRLLLVRYAKQELRWQLGDDLYRKAFSIIMHVAKPMVVGAEGATWRRGAYRELRERLEELNPMGATEEEWEVVCDAVASCATEVLIIADEIWNAQQVNHILEVSMDGITGNTHGETNE